MVSRLHGKRPGNVPVMQGHAEASLNEYSKCKWTLSPVDVLHDVSRPSELHLQLALVLHKEVDQGSGDCG